MVSEGHLRGRRRWTTLGRSAWSRSHENMTVPPVIQNAVESLCERFEEGGYALTPIIDLGALVANADGTVDDSELEMLRYLYHALLGSQLSPEMVQHLVRSSLQVVTEAGVTARAKLIAEILLD